MQGSLLVGEPCQPSCLKIPVATACRGRHKSDSGAAVQRGATAKDRYLASQKTFGTGHGQGVELTSVPPWPQHLLHALTQAAVPGQHYSVACDERLSVLQTVRQDVGCRAVTDMAVPASNKEAARVNCTLEPCRYALQPAASEHGHCFRPAGRTDMIASLSCCRERKKVVDDSGRGSHLQARGTQLQRIVCMLICFSQELGQSRSRGLRIAATACCQGTRV